MWPFKSKPEPYTWRIEKGRHDVTVAMFQDDECLYQMEIESPLWFIGLRVWRKKSIMRTLYNNDTYIRQAGFTLVELLVAAALLGVISITISNTLVNKKKGEIHENISNAQRTSNLHISNDKYRRPCESR